MIVLEFKLNQNEGLVEVFIRVPYIKVSACEFGINGKSFKFYLKPYLLSLAFEQNLKDVEEPANAIYYHTVGPFRKGNNWRNWILFQA
jgi:hypothetical protein